MSPRETIYAALFALVAATPGIRTSSRRVKHWNEVATPDQPAIFMAQRSERADVTTNMPAKWSFRVDLVLYGHNGGQDNISPMSVLNPIVDSIVETLNPTTYPTEQTLGGLVHRCRIDGDIQTDEGVLGDQAVVVIPVLIFAPQ